MACVSATASPSARPAPRAGPRSPGTFGCSLAWPRRATRSRATSSWSTIPSPPEPRISPHLIALGGKLYLLGGTTPRDGDSFTPNQRVDVYDPATKTWSTALEALPVSVRHMRFFPYGERILCVSTHTAGARAVRVLLFEP